MASDGTTAARLLVDVQGRGISETAAGLGRMDSAVRGSSQGIGGLVRAAGGIYAVKKAFDFTIGSAIEWESAFAGVEKTVDASDAELSKLEDTLLGMSRTMPIAAGELAGIAEAAGALGIATQDIEGFTRTVAMIGETTNVSADQAATSLGQLSNVLGLTADDYDNFGAALVDLGNKGASTEQDILGIASRAGAGAALIDMAADSTLGWSAAVANLGIEAEAGGSALQRFFLEMTTHVAAAGDELDAIAQTAGMTASEFTRAFGQDSSAALQTFIGGMEDLTQAEQLALLELLGFNDVRISRTLLGLAGNTEQLNKALDNAATGWEENTALTTEYGKRADTTAAKIEVLGNRFADLGRRMGEAQGGPVDFAIGTLDASLSGWEKAFDDAGFAAQLAAGHFGEMGDATNALADDLGESFKRTNNAVTRYMQDTGASFDAALEAVRIYGTGNTAALEQSGRDWEEYQKAISINVSASQGIVEEGMSGMAESAGTLPGMMADELLANQFVLGDATTELVNFMDAAISPAQERFNAQGFLASQELADGLNSGIPSVRAKAEEMRDEALAKLSNLDASAGGRSLVRSWVGGMTSQFYGDSVYKVAGITKHAARYFGLSLPTEGAMAGGLASGGESVAESWLDSMVRTIDAGIPQVAGAIGGVGSLFEGDYAAGVGVGAGATTGGGAVEYHTHIELTVEGNLTAKDEESVVATLQRMSGMLDMRLG